jgi:hypothetical protein
VLATAELYGLGLGGIEFYRFELASLVASVAEGLARTASAGTPVVAFTGFDLDSVWTFFGNLGFRHKQFSSNTARLIIADGAEPPHGALAALTAGALNFKKNIHQRWRPRHAGVNRTVTPAGVFY